MSSLNPSPRTTRPSPAVARGRFTWFLGPGFFLLAAWFLFGPDLAQVPIPERLEVTSNRISIKPLRGIVGEPPTIEIGGYRKTCMECHRIFLSDPPKTHDLKQHTHIRLDHGPLESCVDCHDLKDRDRLLTKEKEKIPFTRSSYLCAKCHERIGEDWKVGAHGKTQKAWDPKDPRMRRFECAECHNPHRPVEPAMQPFIPLPGPNTLRMTKPHGTPEGNHEVEILDPLEKALLIGEEKAGHGAAHDAGKPREGEPHPGKGEGR